MKHLMLLLLAAGVAGLALAVPAARAPYAPKLGKLGPHWLYSGVQSGWGNVNQDPTSLPKEDFSAQAAFRAVQLQDSTPGTQQTGHANISGTMIAGFFKGDGSQLTGVNADKVDGHHCEDFLYTAGSGLQLAANQFSIANGGVATAMLADGAVTGAKLNSSGAGLGQALMWNGTSVVWGNPIAGALQLPYSGSATAATDVFAITQTGTSRAGYFRINYAGSSTAAALMGEHSGGGPAVAGFAGSTGDGIYGYVYNGSGNAVYGYQTGTGRAGYFNIDQTGNASNALEAATTGTGRAGYFRINRAASNAMALEVNTNSTGGAGIYSLHTGGGGNAGYFRINNTASGSSSLYAQTNGSGRCIYGVNEGSGAGLLVELTSLTNSSTVIEGQTAGTGRGAYIHTHNASNSNPALEVFNDGSGNTVHSRTRGTGNAGYFLVDNINSAGNGLYVETKGTGYAGYFVGKSYFSTNVGIGKAPTNALDVSGTVQTTGFKLTTGAANGYVLTSDASGTGTWTAPSWLKGSGTANYLPKFSASDTLTNSVVYETGSNIGIGTTSPGSKLEVAGVIRGTQFVDRDNTAYWLDPSGSTTSLLTAGSVGIGMTTTPGEKLDVAGNARAQSFIDRDNPAYFVNPADATTAATFNGEVGIGTTNPSYKLHVEGVSYFSDGIATADGLSGVGNRFRSAKLYASQTICTIRGARLDWDSTNRQVKLVETHGSYCHYAGHKNEGAGGAFLSGYVTPSNTTVLATLDGNGEYLSAEIAPREGDYGFIRIYCYYDNTTLVCNYQYRYQ